MAAAFACLNGSEKKHWWWLSTRKIVEKYVKDARVFLAMQEPTEIAAALNVLDTALQLSPRCEQALELKARSLLYLRRFKDVADMLQNYIPSVRMAIDDSDSASSDSSSREQAGLLDSSSEDSSLQCFSVSELKKKVMAGFCRSSEEEGHWRFLVLGQACCHLGLMEDAVALLQTWKRLNTAASRRESICWSEDSFSLSHTISGDTYIAPSSPTSPLQNSQSEPESINHLLTHIKFLLRRRAAALAALNAGLYSESIRHFSKIIDSRNGAPQGFLAQCYMNRATAYRTAGRIAESIADCNRTLALNQTCTQALETRAELLESIRCLPDSLHDLEHLRLLYNTMLRNRKLPGPAWNHHGVHYKEIQSKLSALALRIQEMKQRVASGERGRNVDYYGLIGLNRGCTRSEMERAHRILSLRHKPDKALNFLNKCEFADHCDLDSVKDRARMSALLLYRLIQKGYLSLMSTIKEHEEAMEKSRKKAPLNQIHQQIPISEAALNLTREDKKDSKNTKDSLVIHQGVFCRDLAAVGSLLSKSGHKVSIPIKYAALSC